VVKPNKPQFSQLRIIGGQWRGRKLSFPLIDGLRPTPDRVRETVFNWLVPYLGNATCVDLFAGSGALGLEAASRGAAHVDLVELNKTAYLAIQAHLTTLKADNCAVFLSTAQQFIKKSQSRYDIVLMDPPYLADLWTEIAFLLEESTLLMPSCVIYLECPAKQMLPNLPLNWQLIKDKKAGDVRYCLFNRI